MKVGIYIRVSTKEQADEGYSVGEQTERLKAYCLARNWSIHKIYTDPGMTGSNIDRPAIREMISDVRRGDLDIVLVYKLDRLSRSQKDTLYLIEDVFLKHDVDFVSMNENFDTTSPFGRAMIGILSVFAQLEREQITERMAMGRAARAKDGYFHGGGYTPIGYDYIDGELIVNEYEAKQIRLVHKMYLEGTPINQIQKHMSENYTTKYGSWGSHASVRSALIQVISIGKIEWDGEIYEGRHEAILDEETFYRSRKRYEANAWTKDGERKARPFQATNIMTGIMYCGNCGARYFSKGNYSGRGENRKYRPYYTCYSRAKTAKRMIVDPDCKNKSFAVVDFDQIIHDEIKKLSFDTSIIQDIAEKAKAEHERTDSDNSEYYTEQIEQIDNQLSKLLDLYQMDTVPFDEISDRMANLTERKKALIYQMEVEREQIEKHVPELSTIEAEQIVKRAGEILDNGDLTARRELVHSLIDKVVIQPNDDIDIHWAFA